jgi:polyphosphate:AMP phosphotransferase
MLEVAEVGNKIGKEEYKAAVPDLRAQLVHAQYELRDKDFPVIIWIAGDDRLAANEMVNRLNEWMDTRFVDTRVFADNTQEESERPALWRLWRALPPKGRMSIFAGGLMRTAILRADGDMSEEEFSAWLRHVAKMQDMLVADGALVLKFFLHTPAKVQRKKLRKAEKDPEEGWQIDQRDWAMLEQLGPVLPIAERILRETSGAGAPWTIVEASDRRYTDLTVARTVLAALQARLEAKGPSGPSLADSVFGDIDGEATVLSRVDLTKELTKEDYKVELRRQQAKLHKLSVEARKRGVSSVLAFEGWDAAGKGGVIRRVTQALEAGDYRVIPTAAPTEEERKYHYLWRFWRDMPLAGRFTIFDRTWYGRVLVERIEGFAKAAEWQRAYDEINDFEQQLIDRGYYVAKFWLHISQEEQLARFQAREQTSYKQHKITEEDYRNRERWDEYENAIDQMVLRTTAERAPWHVIPANNKLHARVATLKAINKGLSRVLRGN